MSRKKVSKISYLLYNKKKGGAALLFDIRHFLISRQRNFWSASIAE